MFCCVIKWLVVFFWKMHFECNLIVSSKDFYLTCSFEFFAFIHLDELRMTAQSNNKLHLIRTRNSSFMSYWLQSFHCVCCFKNIYTKMCSSLRDTCNNSVQNRFRFKWDRAYSCKNSVELEYGIPIIILHFISIGDNTPYFLLKNSDYF